MSIRIDVCNYALAILGEGEIVGVEDDSDKARILKTLYYIARDSALELAEWTFATKRFMPAKNDIAPEWGWANAFKIPSDIVRLTQVDKNWTGLVSWNDSRQQRNPVDHVVEYVDGVGLSILCNEDPIYCKGIRTLEDEGIYSPLFVEAFAAKLAYLAAMPITSSKSIQQVAMGIYGQTMKEAKTRDGMQNSTRRLRSHSLTGVR